MRTAAICIGAYLLIAIVVVLMITPKQASTQSTPESSPSQWTTPDLGSDPQAYRLPCFGPYCPRR